LTLKLNSLNASGEEPRETLAHSATYQRVAKVAVREVSFASPEYLDVEAQEDVDLTGGYVGDSRRLLWLGSSKARLRKGECLRIVTFSGNLSAGSLPRAPDCQGPLVALQMNGAPTRKGLYKGEAGEGDRVVIFDRRGRTLLDMDFWWLPVRNGTTSDSARAEAGTKHWNSKDDVPAKP